jgi:hypothetical protein
VVRLVPFVLRGMDALHVLQNMETPLPWSVEALEAGLAALPFASRHHDARLVFDEGYDAEGVLVKTRRWDYLNSWPAFMLETDRPTWRLVVPIMLSPDKEIPAGFRQAPLRVAIKTLMDICLKEIRPWDNCTVVEAMGRRHAWIDASNNRPTYVRPGDQHRAPRPFDNNSPIPLLLELTPQ